MYGFRSGGMGGLGDTCTDLATTWYNNLATCNAQGISNTNPACIAANTAYAQGPVDSCNPAVFAATQALMANPNATAAQLQQIVSNNIAGQTSDQIAAAVAAVMAANPSSAGATATPVIIPGSTIVSTSPSGQTVYQMATAANNPVTGAPAVILPTTNQLAPIIPASSPLASTVSVIDTQAGQIAPTTGTVIPVTGQPSAASNVNAGAAPPSAGDSFSLCFPGDPSGQISSSIPICTYTLAGILALFLLLKR